MNNHITEYKDWQSPISLKEVFGKSSSPAFLEARNSCLYWMEQSPQKGGLTQVICRTAESDLIALTSTDFNVRTRANEYGGKAFCIGEDALFFCNDSDQRIYRQNIVDSSESDQNSAQAITIDSGAMYADLTLSQDGRWLFFVMETPQLPENLTQIAVIPTATNEVHTPVVLASGSDFYASLTLSDDNAQLAWIEWMHPNMPWDETRAVIANLHDFVSSRPPTIKDFDLSLYEAINTQGLGATIAHLSFTDKGQLFMTIDWPRHADNELQNFAQLYRWNGISLSNVSNTRDEYSYPHWIYSNHRFVHIDSVNDTNDESSQQGERILAIASNQWGDELHSIDLGTQEITRLGENFVRFTHICADQGIAYVVAESNTSSSQVLQIVDGRVAASPSPEQGLSDTNISHAQSIVVDNDTLTNDHHDDVNEETASKEKTRTTAKQATKSVMLGKKCHAFYYPPKNMRYSSGKNLPPLVVMVHGGPTARAQNHFDIQKQFWTTSGFAVLDVNHRGSTGFGRQYRDALLGKWGLADAEDIYSCVQEVLNKQLAHPQQIFIRGKSAGGYAVQRSLTVYPEIFAAGASYYGIGDLATLASITHKFEGRYCDQLLGEVYDRETASLPLSAYYQRSPIHFMKNIKCPLILFQGLEDKVVPPELSQQVADVLAEQGVEYEYHKYTGEGHGFRSLSTQVDSLSKELLFYRRQMS